MSVPTHNLYDFVHQTTKKQFWIFYFYQWGNRDLSNLIEYQLDINNYNGIPVANRFDFKKYNIFVDYNSHSTHYLCRVSQPNMICHDQEPLDFDLYRPDSELITNYSCQESKFNNLSLKKVISDTIHKKSILLHSELNSSELAKFELTDLFVGAYWWSHAVIARDWYRYAEHDPMLLSSTTQKKLFLAYCRDTTGSRQYREHFLNKIRHHDLIDNCRLQSNHLKTTESYLSAEYHAADFLETAFSIVLETVFDNRIHLTEKTLRPIAVGHPFILANGPGSLKLLQEYGFKTFHPFINEDYDLVVDNEQRLNCIVAEMNRLQSLSATELDAVLSQCKHITDHNKKWFFSDAFFKIIVDQLKHNVDIAYDQTKDKYKCNQWLEHRRELRKNKIPVKKDYERSMLIKLIRQLRNMHGIKACE